MLMRFPLWTTSKIIYTKIKKRVRWIVGLGVPTTLGNELPLAVPSEPEPPLACGM